MQSSHNIKYTGLKSYLNFRVRRKYLVFSREHNPNSFSAGCKRVYFAVCGEWLVFRCFCFGFIVLVPDADASAKQGTSFSNLLHRSVETALMNPEPFWSCLKAAKIQGNSAFSTSQSNRKKYGITLCSTAWLSSYIRTTLVKIGLVFICINYFSNYVAVWLKWKTKRQTQQASITPL